ncbi:hypothetical protein PAPYR_6076 [Paratrimastix pyriformis]|uniref:PB1 domain-containing protein n=1 Tax=Paratrimastix pyriformis TaxID=342808 RepID=A0ABQ8UIJ6_9EUKA|nr:hypothetical protein PAPYR_6076 [Paratrimastix pyriformis]
MKVLFPKGAGFEALKSLIARQFAPNPVVGEISYLSEGETFAITTDEALEGYLQESPLPPLKISLSSAPTHHHLREAPPPVISPNPASNNETLVASLDPLPPAPVCTVRLEASGYPPKVIEIPEQQAGSMPLDVFMGLVAGQYEGLSITGAPSIEPAPSRAGTGLVDSDEALRALLTASLASR